MSSPQHALEAAPRYVRQGGLAVRNLLVSNAEYAVFLNALARRACRTATTAPGCWPCEMPHERGGRLHHESATRPLVPSAPAIEHHPAYWVTWIGAAAFAAWDGARLPTRAELIELTGQITATATNADYRYGDVTPVTEPGRGDGEIHHLAGNLQTWCGDGPPAGQLDGPAARWLFGAAWNTPATATEMQRPRHRHLLGCSRGVGIRLVRDGTQCTVSAAELAQPAGRLDHRAGRTGSRPLAELDERLIGALGGSQADVGLRPHVAPGAGEPGHG